MNRETSTYLDLVRFLAALTVVVCHFTFAQFTGGIVPYQGALAGAAVAPKRLCATTLVVIGTRISLDHA